MDLKLFEVTVLDDADFETELKVGYSTEEIEKKIWDDYNNYETGNSPYSCLMSVRAREIAFVDGYKIILKK